jgi:urease accessory protein UreH/urease accessory protein UreF
MSLKSKRIGSYQHGFAKLIAQNVMGGGSTKSLPKSVLGTTQLTHVSHRAPTRLLPLTGSSLLEQSGKAQCAISNYGGGMVQGDTSYVSLHVETGAQLGVTTQGPNRIYKCPRHRIYSNTSPNLTNKATDIRSFETNSTRKNDRRTFQQQQQGDSFSNDDDGTCHTHVSARIEDGGCLILAPDPTVLFSQSRYEQYTELNLASSKTSSCIAVDWFAAGRLHMGEEWNLDSFATTTQLTYDDDPNPILVDRIRLATMTTGEGDPNGFYRTNFWGSQAMCTIILAGPQTLSVVNRLQQWSSILLAQKFSIRSTTFSSMDTSETFVQSVPIDSLSPNVLISVTPVIPDQLYVTRIAAQCNEDIYRILHDSMLPLNFGVPFYKDRVSSQSTQILNNTVMTVATPSMKTLPTSQASTVSPSPIADTLKGSKGDDQQVQKSIHPHQSEFSTHNNMTNQMLWSSFLLMDSCLPTGSFAHSSGLEVAQQLGWLKSDDQVEAYILAATHSALQLAMPYLVAGMQIVHGAHHYDDDDIDCWLRLYHPLDQSLHALMVSNGPACQASMDQGRGFLRVALSWSEENGDPLIHARLQALRSSDSLRMHLAPLFGIVASSLGKITDIKTARHMLAYSMARDMMSAAIRLNAIGPLASVGRLNRIHQSLQAAQYDDASLSLEEASSSTPILDVLHPCHASMSVRLFRT